MFFATDLSTVTHGIQLAVAPVFLLTAVSGMIGTAASRLARIIDRARLLEDRVESAQGGDEMTPAFDELKRLRLRGRFVNGCITLLTLCAILIGLTIMALFLGETADFQMSRATTVLFLTGVSCFLLALLCFLTETFLATQMLKFGKEQRLEIARSLHRK
jgi:Protein of unknown function (DUF2721)